MRRQDSNLRPPGYETGERSSLGKRADCRQWREEGGERSAAVYIFKAALPAAENIGHRKPGCRNDKGDLLVRRISSPASATKENPKPSGLGFSLVIEVDSKRAALPKAR